MRLITVPLEENNPAIKLVCYIADDKNNIRAPRDAMLVIPGGGYGCICDDREGEPIALAFLARGYNCFVLSYHIAPVADPYDPLIDASKAMAHIKENAENYHINPERVFAVGFSAGGHLCATLGTMWKDEALAEKTGLPHGINRPTGVILCYPVISAEKVCTHRGSFANLLGDKVDDKALCDAFSPENRADAESSPAFIIHTFTDQIVPFANSFVMAEALAGKGVMCELHVYPKGPHGMALANEDTAMGNEVLVDTQYARWVDDACKFFKRIK